MKRALLVLALLLTPAAFGQTATPTSTPTPTATPTPTKTPTPPFPQTTQITGLSSTTVVGTDEFAVDKDVSGVRRTRKVTATQIGDFFDTTEVWDGIRVEDGDDTGSFTVMDEMDMDDSGDIGFARAAGPPDVLTATVRDEKVTEAKLKAVDSATDEECLTYETTTGDFEWQACGSGTNLPGGSDTQVQYNDGGSFGGDSGLTFNETTNALSVSGDIGAGGNISISDSSGDSPGITFVPQTGDTFSILQVDATDTLLFGVTSADVENVSINNLGAGTVNLALDGDFTATTLAGNLSCTNCINETEVEDIYLLNSGDASTGTISLGDGAGDSPGITFVPQTGDSFSILQVDSTDTLLFGISSADTEAAAFTNLGAGVVNLTVDGDFTAANLSGAINLEAASAATGVADDEVPVGTAANTLTYKAVPDCDDSGGNHLNYDTGANAFTCGTSGDGTGAPGGADTQVQFNDSGSFGGDAGLTYNKTTNLLSLTDNLFSAGSATFQDGLAVIGDPGATPLEVTFQNENALGALDFTINSGDSAAGSVIFSDTSANRARIQATTADALVLATGSGLTTALTLDSSQAATFAGAVNLTADAVDAITEIAAALKSGSDLTLITGTEGGSGICAEWDANGDLVAAASAAACGAGGGFPREYSWSASGLLPLEAANAFADSGVDAGTNVDIPFIAYNDSTDECMSQSILVPRDIDASGTLTFDVVWYSATATTGNIIWDVRHTSGQAEGVTWDSALTTETASADATQGTVDQVTFTTWTETVSNAGWAANDRVTFLFCRDANNASDTLVGDALLTDVRITVPLA